MTTAIAQGKVNLVFQVGPKRADGYHEVASIYQALQLSEKVTVSPSAKWEISLSGDVPGIDTVPLDASNLVIKAALALSRRAGIENPQPMRFEIDKQIPVAGGMAGGSADAAASLVALNEAWCLGFDQQTLLSIGAELGADVPFALLGGTAFGSGSGTELLPLEAAATLHVVLVFSEFGLSTKNVFEEFDRLNPNGDKLSLQPRAPYQALIGHNSLQSAALSLAPQLGKILELNLGVNGGFLSGSGPTVWFYSDSKAKAEAALEIATGFGCRAILTKTSELGARLS